jgi:hypothetical protein
MGFNRTLQPAALDRAGIRCAVIVEFRREEEIAATIGRVMAEADPFGIDHDCANPAGHYPVRCYGEIVCPHCSKVLWS